MKSTRIEIKEPAKKSIMGVRKCNKVWAYIL